MRVRPAAIVRGCIFIINVLAQSVGRLYVAQRGGNVFSHEPRLSLNFKAAHSAKVRVFKNGQVIHCGFSLYRNLYVLLLRLN